MHLPSFRQYALATVFVTGLSSCAVHTPPNEVSAVATLPATEVSPVHPSPAEVKSLRGKPSSEMILEALSPSADPKGPATLAAKHNVRRRGLSLGRSDEAPKVRALDLEVHFQFNSDRLTKDGRDVLDQLATALKSDKLSDAQQVILEGHADAKGAAAYNQTLSLKRAQSARHYLASRHGISNAKLKAVGKGASELADPANPESEVNRRVRVIVGL